MLTVAPATAGICSSLASSSSVFTVNTLVPAGTASAARIASCDVQVLPSTIVPRAVNRSDDIAPYRPPAATSNASAAPARTGVRPADARFTGLVRRIPPPVRTPGLSATVRRGRTEAVDDLRGTGLGLAIVSAAARPR